MPKCINDPTRSYKGTEPSPKGLGYCAHAMKLGTVMKGKNKEMWKVKKTKNGIKRWVKTDEKASKINIKSLKKWQPIKLIKQKKKSKWFIPLKTFFNLKVIHPNKIINYIKNKTVKKLITKVKKEINDLEIDFLVVPLILSKDGKYWDDYSKSYISHYYGDVYKNSFVHVDIYMNKDTSLDRDKPVVIQYYLTKEKRKIISNVLKKNFPKKFSWSGKSTDAMLINF